MARRSGSTTVQLAPASREALCCVAVTLDGACVTRAASTAPSRCALQIAWHDDGEHAPTALSVTPIGKELRRVAVGTAGNLLDALVVEPRLDQLRAHDARERHQRLTRRRAL